jgi:predicted nucleic acid-binding protein
VAEQTYPHGLIDTDIIIVSGHRIPPAAFINAIALRDGVHLSVVSAMELRDLKRVLAAFTVVQITAEVSRRAQALIESYTLSHGLDLPDALIAATALVADLPLYTRNARHYRMIPDLKLLQPY